MSGGLKVRLASTMTAVTVAALIALSVAYLLQFRSTSATFRDSSDNAMRDALIAEAGERARTTAEFVASMSANSFYRNEYKTIFEIVDAAVSNAAIRRVTVYDDKGHVLYDGGEVDGSGDAGSTSAEEMANVALRTIAEGASNAEIRESDVVAVAPVAIGTQSMGAVRLVLSLEKARQQISALQTASADISNAAIQRLLTSGVLLTLVLSLSAAVVGLFAANGLARPLSAMTAVMSRLAGGDEAAAIPGMSRRDEIGEMARSLTIIRDAGVRAERVRTALDNASSIVLMTDREGQIVFANKATRAYFAEIAPEVKDALPQLRATELDGAPGASLFPDVEAWENRLRNVEEPMEKRVKFGQRTAFVTLNPVIGAGHSRLGTVIEWRDATKQIKAEADKAERLMQERARDQAAREAEQSFQAELSTVVEAAAGGDFSQFLKIEGRSGLMLQLGEGLNRLLRSVKAALDEIVVVNAALAAGDLTARVIGDYTGEFKRLKEDTNVATIKTAEVIDSLSQGMATIKSATEQLASGAKDLSARTEEQVASLEEMAASIRQMSVTVKQNAENAQKANELALSARESAENGGSVASQAVAAVEMIDESSAKISEIVGVIDEIAFQTNLLALNAAVEAARAGDAGRGFGVVAEEVRALAQRSSQASKEIKALIASSNGHVKRGVDLVGKAGTSLGEIVMAVKRVSEFVSEIAAASQEQADGVRQVDDTVTQLEGVTQKNASLVEESTASLNSVDRQVDEIMNVVSFFRLEERDARGIQSQLAQRVEDGPPSASPPPVQQEQPAGPVRWGTGRWKGF